jgi:hypothetical protein
MRFNTLRECLSYMNDNFDSLKVQRELNWAHAVAAMVNRLGDNISHNNSTEQTSLVPTTSENAELMGILLSMRTAISRSILTEYLGVMNNPMAAFFAYMPEIIMQRPESEQNRKKTKRSPETLMQSAETALDKMGFRGFEYQDHTDVDLWITGYKQDGTRRTLHLVRHHGKRPDSIALLKAEDALRFPSGTQQIEILPYAEQPNLDENHPEYYLWQERAILLTALLHYEGTHVYGDMGFAGDGPETVSMGDIALVNGKVYIRSPQDIHAIDHAKDAIVNALRHDLKTGALTLPQPDAQGIAIAEGFIAFGGTNAKIASKVKKWAADKQLHLVPLLNQRDKKLFIIIDPSQEQNGQTLAKDLRVLLQTKALPKQKRRTGPAPT